MRTNTYLFIICLLLPICQSCIKELHDLPPRPEITVKLNGIIQDTIIIAPGEDVNIEVECNAQKGILQEVTIKDKVSMNLPGFPLTQDSSLLQNKSSYSYRFNANDYMADGGQAYQTYDFQVICQDNNNPNQLRSIPCPDRRYRCDAVFERTGKLLPDPAPSRGNIFQGQRRYVDGNGFRGGQLFPVLHRKEK